MTEKIRKPSVNVVIPVYNEERELASSVGTLRQYLTEHLPDFSWHITIADNASRDRTLAIAKDLSRKFPEVSYVHLPQKGRGRAVKYVWVSDGADIEAYMDVDLSTDLKHFPPLLRSLTRGYDIAIGTRNASGSRVYGRTMLRTFTSKMYISIIKIFFWVHFSDAQCGFKAVTRRIVREIIPKVLDNEWFFDSELLILAEKTGYRIYEEQVTWIDNPGSTVRVLKTAQGDLAGLKRLFFTRPWRNHGRR
jgi:glycosyltransferase involved in cell wall biosynthesis